MEPKVYARWGSWTTPEYVETLMGETVFEQIGGEWSRLQELRALLRLHYAALLKTWYDYSYSVPVA